MVWRLSTAEPGGRKLLQWRHLTIVMAVVLASLGGWLEGIGSLLQWGW